LYSEKPSFPVVRYFSTVLGFSAEDYDKDLELQVRDKIFVLFTYTSVFAHYSFALIMAFIVLEIKTRSRSMYKTQSESIGAVEQHVH